MIKWVWYRWFKVMTGSRSFVKYHDDASTGCTYILIRGGTKEDTTTLAEKFSMDGYIEEFIFEHKENNNG